MWNTLFKSHRPAPKIVCDWVTRLHQDAQHQQVIACLRAALVHGQAQPWMYEVLALSMEIEGYPKEDVERVVLSLSDFGNVDYESMMLSGAYLTRFGRKSAALSLYRQSARLFPERPEPYLLGLKLAQSLESVEEIEWAASGILRNCWEEDQKSRRRDAENALLEQIRQLQKKGNSAQAATLQQTLASAKSPDVEVRLEWHGDADLDLQVEEPGGAICSLESRQTTGGGMFLHDGLGPDPKQAYELYVCPQAVSGPYRVLVKTALGKPVGDRALLTVTIHAGLPQQRRLTRTLSLVEGEASFSFDLPDGRRTQPRIISQRQPPASLTEEALLKLATSHPGRRVRSQRAPESQPALQPAGAFGYVPTPITLLDGTAMTGQVVVSGDRRYVRMALQPQVSTVTDVFTFSFLNGNSNP
ncbi:hypothetical protein [Planctomicrobium sp. SH664]|uniref:hypothetical protein n=1 Tax=Planctomicrobium sp. SH664 TaxID=3448125 RepID=UPI003F5BBB99